MPRVRDLNRAFAAEVKQLSRGRIGGRRQHRGNGKAVQSRLDSQQPARQGDRHQSLVGKEGLIRDQLIPRKGGAARPALEIPDVAALHQGGGGKTLDHPPPRAHRFLDEADLGQGADPIVIP